MNKTLHKIELFVDWIIPYLVIILLVLIVLEFGFSGYVAPYDSYFTLFDYVILVVFCIDLAFKYMKTRKIPLFLRKHWLDIIAVFPFFLIFRLFQEVYAFASIPSLLTEPPTLIHEGIILEKEGLRLVKAAEETEKVSRTGILLRFLKPLQRSPRLVKIIPYFEKPTKKHHETIDSIKKEKSKKDSKKKKR